MHNPFTHEQNEKINIFISLALEFNKTHNIFSRKDNQEVFQKAQQELEILLRQNWSSYSW